MEAEAGSLDWDGSKGENTNALLTSVAAKLSSGGSSGGGAHGCGCPSRLWQRAPHVAAPPPPPSSPQTAAGAPLLPPPGAAWLPGGRPERTLGRSGSEARRRGFLWSPVGPSRGGQGGAGSGQGCRHQRGSATRPTPACTLPLPLLAPATATASGQPCGGGAAPTPVGRHAAMEPHSPGRRLSVQPQPQRHSGLARRRCGTCQPATPQTLQECNQQQTRRLHC